MTGEVFSWYRIVRGSELQQGDILEECPVFIPPDDFSLDGPAPVVFDWEVRDVGVMTQSCDLVTGREKASEVLLCPFWGSSQFRAPHHLATARGLEDARRGNLPVFHLLAAGTEPAFQREVRVVDFRHIHTLPLAHLRFQAEKRGDRLRLLPPYREHLSQAFARFFMRVGLPVDIPPFR